MGVGSGEWGVGSREWGRREEAVEAGEAEEDLSLAFSLHPLAFILPYE